MTASQQINESNEGIRVILSKKPVHLANLIVLVAFVFYVLDYPFTSYSLRNAIVFEYLGPLFFAMYLFFVLKIFFSRNKPGYLIVNNESVQEIGFFKTREKHLWQNIKEIYSSKLFYIFPFIACKYHNGDEYVVTSCPSINHSYKELAAYLMKCKPTS